MGILDTFSEVHISELGWIRAEDDAVSSVILREIRPLEASSNVTPSLHFWIAQFLSDFRFSGRYLPHEQTGRTFSSGKLKSQGAGTILRRATQLFVKRRGIQMIQNFSSVFSVLLTLYFFLPCGSGDLCHLSCLVYPHIPFPPMSAVLAHLSLCGCMLCYSWSSKHGEKGKRANFSYIVLCTGPPCFLQWGSCHKKTPPFSLVTWAWACSVPTEYQVIFFVFKLLRNLCPFCCH